MIIRFIKYLTALYKFKFGFFWFTSHGRHLDITVVHGREHVIKLKPKQRYHPLKFAGFHNQSPRLCSHITFDTDVNLQKALQSNHPRLESV